MARFTVEDCLEVITNRFDMTLSASMRAREIEKGNALLIDSINNDKPTVLALREIAQDKINSDILGKIE